MKGLCRRSDAGLLGLFGLTIVYSAPLTLMHFHFCYGASSAIISRTGPRVSLLRRGVSRAAIVTALWFQDGSEASANSRFEIYRTDFPPPLKIDASAFGDKFLQHQDNRPHLLLAFCNQPCSPERQASWPGGRRPRPPAGSLPRPSRDDSSPVAARTAMSSSRILPSAEEGGHHNCRHRHRHPPDTTPRPAFPCPSRSSR